MAILTHADYLASTKQAFTLRKTATRTSVASAWFSVFDLAGSPGAGVLAGTSTVNGVVPTDATAGTFPINAFGGGAKGYIGGIDYGSSVACRIRVCDMLFKCGAYAFNANTALTAQPSFAGRLPGTDYKGLEIWVEQVTVATGNQAVNVTYTDQDGNAGATTGAVGISAAPTVGRMWPLPLASGDSGVQLITNVQGSVATVGTFNVLVLRPLLSVRCRTANDGGILDYVGSRLPEIYADSALIMMIAADSTSTGVPDIHGEIVNK